jgi:cation transport regulator ChaB
MMKKKKVILYEQNLNTKDILFYLPDSLKRKLSKQDKKYIQEAFYLAVMDYQKRYEEKHLDRMLI